ncbi:MAG: glucose-6-phosphate isomerase [Oscillospiraceae bacterium]|nr:glucose-6-phosphate isomerase [Oscillospiraceae bacterium]
MRLKLDISNIQGFLSDGQLSELRREAGEALKRLSSGSGAGAEFTGWMRPLDKGPELELIRQNAGKIQKESDALVVIGIGGSYLGARAALEFVKSPLYNAFDKDTPDIFFVGNSMSPDAINETIALLGDRDFSINVISKSGTTTEPAVAFRVFRSMLEKRCGREASAKRIYATTDREKGVLRAMARQEGYQCFAVPDDVGGRYSVLTPVGLLPLAVAGVDIDEMLAAARGVFERPCAGDTDDPVIGYAAARSGLYRAGKRVEILAAFEPSLRFVCEWWKQLFGESEGKNHKGLFPASVINTADLHSMGQYIQDGERILTETFLKVEKGHGDITVPDMPDYADELDYLSGRSFTWANHQALAATQTAHAAGGVPNMRIDLPDRSAGSFGELVTFFELACAVSGYMLGVNPFDQPGVEEYKKNMFSLLGRPGY